jgi:hypothetical protein
MYVVHAMVLADTLVQRWLHRDTLGGKVKGAGNIVFVEREVVRRPLQGVVG